MDGEYVKVGSKSGMYCNEMQVTLKQLPETRVTVEFIILRVLLSNATVAKGFLKCIILNRPLTSIYAQQLC